MNLQQNKELIAEALATKGWIVLDDFFDPELIQELASECRLQYQLGLLKEAGVGRGGQIVVEKSIRGDQTRWLEPGMSSEVDLYLQHVEQLRAVLNELLYLGLQETEQHFAFYPQGAFYQKHLDRFRDEDRRVVSSVLYLNPDWKPEHGGELRLHLGESIADIEPKANRYVLFMSAQIQHEVRPTATDRLSLTGWFKRSG